MFKKQYFLVRYFQRANFLPFLKITVPKCPLAVGTSEGIFFETNSLFKKIF